MKSTSLRLWLLVLLSALLQVAAFPIWGPVSSMRGGLSWIALVPLFAALLGNPVGVKQTKIPLGALAAYGCGIVWYLGNCSWIYQTMYLYGGLAKPVAGMILLLFALYLGIYHALFGWLTVFLRRRLSLAWTLVLVPFLWVAIELARARITYFPWDLLGYARVDSFALGSIAPLTGVMGMSFVIAAGNALFTAAVVTRGRSQSACVLAGVLLVALCEGGNVFLSSHSAGKDGFDGVSAGPLAVMVQENLSVGSMARLGTPLTVEQELGVFAELSRNALVPRESAACPQCRSAVLVWPEAPSHFQTNDPRLLNALEELASELQVPVIAGGLGVDLDARTERGYHLYDSAALVESNGRYQGRYDKIHLVPWGEYVPFKQFFSFAQKLTEGVGDMDAGTARTVFAAGGHRYGVFICYESIFGDEVRQFVRNGADVLVNISDDGWYGDSGAPWQHLNMARMRAMENRRWIIRSTNTGETTTIDPWGRYTATERHVRVAYKLPFGYSSALTFYTRYGDWFAWMCAAMSGCAVAWAARAGSTGLRRASASGEAGVAPR